MMARVSFGLRGMWLPLFFQIMSNMIFVRYTLANLGLQTDEMCSLDYRPCMEV